MKRLNEDFFKIHFIPSETVVRQDGEKVYAKLTGVVTTPHWGEFNGEINTYQDVALLPFNVTAEACATPCSEDTFDFEKGKKIALAKAENKCYTIALRKIMHRVDELLEFNEHAFDFAKKTYSVIQHNEDYIERIGG